MIRGFYNLLLILFTRFSLTSIYFHFMAREGAQDSHKPATHHQPNLKICIAPYEFSYVKYLKRNCPSCRDSQLQIQITFMYSKINDANIWDLKCPSVETQLLLPNQNCLLEYQLDMFDLFNTKAREKWKSCKRRKELWKTWLFIGNESWSQYEFWVSSV